MYLHCEHNFVDSAAVCTCKDIKVYIYVTMCYLSCVLPVCRCLLGSHLAQHGMVDVRLGGDLSGLWVRYGSGMA